MLLEENELQEVAIRAVEGEDVPALVSRWECGDHT
jgi:hypothetical protein